MYIILLSIIINIKINKFIKNRLDSLILVWFI